MALAHEIAVDKDFSLQKIQPANEVEKKVHLRCAFPTPDIHSYSDSILTHKTTLN